MEHMELMVKGEYGPEKYSSLKGVNIQTADGHLARLGMKGERSQRMFCDLPTFFRTFRLDKVLTHDEKGSASPSIIAFATFIGEKQERVKYNTRVAIKTFLSVREGAAMPAGIDMESLTKFLLHEWWIYENVIKTIMDDNNSINFVKCYATGKCNMSELLDTMAHLPTDDRKREEFIIAVRNLFLHKKVLISGRQMYPLSRFFKPEDVQLNMIITELAPNTMSLYDYLATASRKDKAAVELQVLHGLHIMERYGIAHNDIHLGNILVQLAPDEQAINYDIGGSITYRIDISSMDVPAKVLLFDWDRGTSLHSTNEALMAWACPEFGQCPDFVPGVDAVSFAEMAGIPGLPKVAGLRYDEQGRPCFSDRPGGANCARARAPGVRIDDYLHLFGPNGGFTAVARIIVFLTVKLSYFHMFLTSFLEHEAIEASITLFIADQGRRAFVIPPEALVPLPAIPRRKREARDQVGHLPAGRRKVGSVQLAAAVPGPAPAPAPPGEASIYATAGIPDPAAPGPVVRPILMARRRRP